MILGGVHKVGSRKTTHSVCRSLSFSGSFYYLAGINFIGQASNLSRP